MAVENEGRSGQRGLGLISMRERAELMGGELHLRQPPQGGLLVSVRVPARAHTERGQEVA
jgi:signal transduction histidine kinase